ncbi:hypothetical protein [Streptomyces sp. NPDC050804]|uniref:vWA-MoxR associated conflict system protein n=1 Tax=Streptomyces sp. NPDC050804 TaxID=3154745 RepID=UPI00342A449B
MTGPRLLLVVAPQNSAMGTLTELENAARELSATLMAGGLGGCEASPGTPLPLPLLYGPGLTQARIEAAVRAAIGRAGETGATLVLAFLGHGITPGSQPTLYLMAGDSRPDTLSTAVNVSELLVQAVEEPGVDGVIGIVDTCHAAGAVPDLKALGSGVRGGRTRLSLLMSSQTGQEAYDLAFSRRLDELLRRGLPGEGAFVGISAAKEALRRTVTGQDVVSLEHDGDHFAAEPLWLARNACHRDTEGPGPVGAEELRGALDAAGLDGAWPAEWTLPAVGELRDRVRDRIRKDQEERGGQGEQGAAGAGPRPPLVRALQVVDGLRICLVTHSFLTSWMGGALTTERLRRALPALPADTRRRLPESSGTELLRDLLESLILRVPRVGGSRTAPLARFVAALALDASLDLTAPEAVAWAESTGARIELNDAREELGRGVAARRMRLVIGLHATVADGWPESLGLWLLDGGQVCERTELPCVPAQNAVEAGLGEAIGWARRHARLRGSPLRQVDIAVPAGLLTRWKPEETDFGVRLGVHHDVVLRWSHRLNPPAHLWWINDHARSGLERMASRAAKTAPVDWLSERETGRPQELGDRLRSGAYTRALALGHRPAQLEQVMELLLAYAPIVVWPDGDGEFTAAERTVVDTFWDRLPAELAEAYRRRWRDGPGPRGPEDGPGDELHAGSGGGSGGGLGSVPADPESGRLADLRTVWHDLEWLDFCAWLEGGPDPTHGSFS